MSRLLLDKIPCGVLQVSTDHVIQEVNNFCCSLTGYTESELIGQKLDVIFTLATRIFCQTHFYPLLKLRGEAEEIFFALRSKSGEDLPVLLNASQKDETIALVFMHVPNRKKFEDELVWAKRTAETALSENSALLSTQEALLKQSTEVEEHLRLIENQNNELNQVNYALSHNLREPLRKLLIYLEMLDVDQDKVQFEKTISKVNLSASQLKNIVYDLQQYIWIKDEKMHFTKIDLEKCVQDVIKNLEETNSEVQLELSMEKLLPLEADREQMQILLHQILSNAYKYRKGNKVKIAITTDVIKQNTFRKVKHKYLYEDYLRIEFRDNGIGFDPSQKEEIFGLFRKMHHNGGQGLGLALCKKIAENHSGFISANSLPGKYTTISVILPLKPISKVL